MKNPIEIFEKYLEGSLAPDELAAFETAIQQDPGLRRELAGRLHLEGVLRAEAHDLFSDAEEIEAEATLTRGNHWRVAVAAAALLMLGLAAGWLLRPGSGENVAGPKQKPAIATLADIRSAKWGASSLPTEDGARLRPGKLELLEGLATVKFDSGATVTLEAPATVLLESEKLCRLVSGAAVAWVPDGAEGFQIQTADALVTDYGTRFGVTAGANGKSEVLVLEGEVGVTHRKGEEEKRLTTGEMVRYDAEALIAAAADDADETPRLASPIAEGNWTAITTGDGAGRDGYVRQEHEKSFGEEPLLMVKNSSEFAGNRRKAYLAFDLSAVQGRDIAAVEFDLSIQNSGLGYASVVPDATFAVFGLTDESLDREWDETAIRWESAPANVLDHGFQLQPEKVTLLGEFVVEQGISSGVRTIREMALAEFLRADRNGIATLIVVRLTDETDRHGLVHAFASAEHPAAMAPTLRLRFE